MRIFRYTIVVVTIMLINAANVTAQLSLPALFSDNMVLQQEQLDPVWGNAAPGKVVTVQFLNKSYTALADKDGKWMIKLSKAKYGGPYEMKIFCEKDSVLFHNVMIGEVWVCSGQSNMAMQVKSVINSDQEIASATYPGIRLLQVEKTLRSLPQTELKVTGGVSWQECSPSNVGNFAATAYFFARDVYKKTGIPIGLIQSAVSGTNAELWASRASLKNMKDFQEELKGLSADSNYYRNTYEARLAAWRDKLDVLDKAFEKGEPAWKKTTLPGGYWRKNILPDFSGIVWYKKEIEFPKELAGQNLSLSLGKIVDEDVCYFNGAEIGRTIGASKDRIYSILQEMIHPGKNILTIKVIGYYDGGFTSPPQKLVIKPGKPDSMILAGEWSFHEGVHSKNLPRPNLKYNPGSLFNGMIAPLIPFGIRGVIWYQGEDNSPKAYQYRELFPTMIKGWRKAWKQGDFPFYYVQLPRINKPDSANASVKSQWAELRESQFRTLSLPNTAMAVTIDQPDPDLHPKNKQDFGHRLALLALAKIYHQGNQFTGPLYKKYSIEGNAIRISFSNPEVGLKIKEGNELKGFVMAGEDQVFYPAIAKIEGNTVVVSCDKVGSPKSVRYAWANSVINNLCSSEDLPASPFRTDDWEMITRIYTIK